MKRSPFVCLAALLACAAGVYAANYSLSISTSSTVVVPRDAAFVPEAVVSNAVAQGQVVAYSGIPYMSLTGTNEAPASADATFVRVGKEKSVAVVQNQGAADLWLAFDSAAAASSGLKLAPGASVTIEDYTGNISAITSAGSSAATVVLLYK